MGIDLYFAENKPPIVCRNVDELENAIDRLHMETDSATPICVEIQIAGFAIDIGLGSDLSFMIIQVEPCDGEYYQAVGDSSAEGYVDFWGCGNHTPIDRRNMVAHSAVRDGVRAFVARRELLQTISWEDWAGNPAPLVLRGGA